MQIPSGLILDEILFTNTLYFNRFCAIKPIFNSSPAPFLCFLNFYERIAAQPYTLRQYSRYSPVITPSTHLRLLRYQSTVRASPSPNCVFGPYPAASPPSRHPPTSAERFRAALACALSALGRPEPTQGRVPPPATPQCDFSQIYDNVRAISTSLCFSGTSRSPSSGLLEYQHRCGSRRFSCI